MEKDIWNNENLIDVLQEGGVVVMPTDTIYGIVGQALNMFTVERIYNIRRREESKPCIILIGDLAELDKFSISISEEQKKVLSKKWPGPTSVILECTAENFFYLSKGAGTLAFRLPAEIGLQNLLKKVGPLVAPSANPEGEFPAENISQAREYFADLPDLYIDGGELKGKPSKLIKLRKDGSVSILRE